MILLFAFCVCTCICFTMQSKSEYFKTYVFNNSPKNWHNYIQMFLYITIQKTYIEFQLRKIIFDVKNFLKLHAVLFYRKGKQGLKIKYQPFISKEWSESSITSPLGNYQFKALSSGDHVDKQIFQLHKDFSLNISMHHIYFSSNNAGHVTIKSRNGNYNYRFCGIHSYIDLYPPGNTIIINTVAYFIRYDVFISYSIIDSNKIMSYLYN